MIQFGIFQDSVSRNCFRERTSQLCAKERRGITGADIHLPKVEILPIRQVAKSSSIEIPACFPVVYFDVDSDIKTL